MADDADTGMKIAGGWLDAAATQAICALLAGAGHQALLVGGCVRNALLGVPVGDIDMATDALPGQVIDLAEAAGLRVLPTGVAHGTVTIIHSGTPHEVTTFRRDLQTDGRHATVAFSRRIEEDAARRDFTMNALYATADGRVLDPLAAMPDVLARRVRFVGDADARIREDYLRILRFFRFYAVHGDPDQGIDADGLAACAALSGGIDTLSRERLGAEMRKLLSAPDPAPALAAMARAGVLDRVLPGAQADMMAALVHVEHQSAMAPRWLRRLAALGGQGAADRLRLSRAEAQALDHTAQARESTRGIAATAFLFGAEATRDALALRAAGQVQPLAPIALQPEVQAEIARGAAARFPVVAADLMPALAGPALGQRLDALRNRWIASDLRMGRSALLAD